MNTTKENHSIEPYFGIFSRYNAMEELPEREAIEGLYPHPFDEEELEAKGIICPVSYFYPDDFDFSVEELPENQDVSGYYPDND